MITDIPPMFGDFLFLMLGVFFVTWLVTKLHNRRLVMREVRRMEAADVKMVTKPPRPMDIHGTYDSWTHPITGETMQTEKYWLASKAKKDHAVFKANAECPRCELVALHTMNEALKPPPIPELPPAPKVPYPLSITFGEHEMNRMCEDNKIWDHQVHFFDDEEFALATKYKNELYWYRANNMEVVVDRQFGGARWVPRGYKTHKLPKYKFADYDVVRTCIHCDYEWGQK